MKKVLFLLLVISGYVFFSGEEVSISDDKISTVEVESEELKPQADLESFSSEKVEVKAAEVKNKKRTNIIKSLKNIQAHKVEDYFNDEFADKVIVLREAEKLIISELKCLSSRKCRLEISKKARYGDEFNNEKTKRLASALTVLTLAKSEDISNIELSDSEFQKIVKLENDKLRSLALEIKLTQEELDKDSLTSLFETSKNWEGQSLVALFETIVKSEHYSNKDLKPVILSELQKRLSNVDAHSALLMVETTLADSKNLFSAKELSYVFSGSCQNKEALKSVGAWNLIKNKIQIEKNLRNIESSLVTGCGV